MKQLNPNVFQADVRVTSAHFVLDEADCERFLMATPNDRVNVLREILSTKHVEPECATSYDVAEAIRDIGAAYANKRRNELLQLAPPPPAPLSPPDSD